jgi:hypothetical protein
VSAGPQHTTLRRAERFPYHPSRFPLWASAATAFAPTLPALMAAGLGFFGWRRFKAGK